MKGGWHGAKDLNSQENIWRFMRANWPMLLN